MNLLSNILNFIPDVVDKILLNFDRTGGCSRISSGINYFAVVFLALSCLGTKGVKEEKITWNKIRNSLIGRLHLPADGRGMDVAPAMATFQKRLKALSAKVEQESIILTESQVAALERAKEEKVAHGQIETFHPNIGSQDTYYVGNIKGVGHIYQQICYTDLKSNAAEDGKVAGKASRGSKSATALLLAETFGCGELTNKWESAHDPKLPCSEESSNKRHGNFVRHIFFAYFRCLRFSPPRLVLSSLRASIRAKRKYELAVDNKYFKQILNYFTI